MLCICIYKFPVATATVYLLVIISFILSNFALFLGPIPCCYDNAGIYTLKEIIFVDKKF